MSHSKHGVRALGLCFLAALSLTAFMATAAHAATGWLVNKEFIKVATPIHAVIHPLADGKKHAVLLSTFGATNTAVEILCETLATEGGSLVASEKAEGAITLNFSKCQTFLKKETTASAPCKPAEPIVATTKFHAILHTKGVTHDNKTYLLFEPSVAGKAFTTIKFGEECAIGLQSEVTGEYVAECLNEKLEKNISTTDYCLEDLVHHLLQGAPTKLFQLEGKAEGVFDELKFGAREATLDGIADALLSAPNLGKTWAVHI